MRRTAETALLLLLLVMVVQVLYYWPRLPDMLISQFDVEGRATSYSSKTEFFVLFGAVVALLATVFYGLPRLLDRLPVSMINVPNRAWLEPEHREATVEHLSSQLVWVGAATQALMVALLQLTIRANLEAKPLDSRVLWLVGLYSLGMLFWAVRIVVRYSRDPSGTPP